jgi:SAM-dependent methyltransferase
MNEEQPAEPCCFDEWATRSAARARRKEVAAPITRRILDALERQGLAGRTVLDVGCGTGDLAISTVRRGADRASGIDLAGGAIEEARSLARDRGVADRVAFAVGDGSIAPLAAHDVVALNRVLCCYPSVDRLLANSLGAAGSVYAYTAPIHTGLVGLFNRTSVAISNAWFRLRRRKFRGFQAFVHDLDAVDRAVEEAGFRRVRASREAWIWKLAVFVRA